VWTGETAVEIGLVDGLGDLDEAVAAAAALAGREPDGYGRR
jgi:ClpP class serine protease